MVGQDFCAKIHTVVPQPDVDVTLNRTAPLYAWTALTLICTVTLDPNVDTNPRIMGLWNSADSSNKTIQELHPVSDKESVGFLTITPLLEEDIVAHTYVLWNSKEEAMYCSLNSTSANITITVMGELYP